MADDAPPAAAAPPAAPSAPGGGGHHGGHGGHGGPAETAATNAANHKSNGDAPGSPVLEEIVSLTSPRLYTPNPFSRKNTSLDLDDYFVCPSPRHGWCIGAVQCR